MNLNAILSEALGNEPSRTYAYGLENKTIYYLSKKGYKPLRAYKRSKGQYGKDFYIIYVDTGKRYISEAKLKKIIEEKLKNGSQKAEGENNNE